MVAVPADSLAVMRNCGDRAYTPHAAQQALERIQVGHALVTGMCDERDIRVRSIFDRQHVSDIRARMQVRQPTLRGLVISVLKLVNRKTGGHPLRRSPHALPLHGRGASWAAPNSSSAASVPVGG